MKNEKTMNIILLSPPGGGKGTLAEQIIQKYNYLHISTGSMLREAKNADTELGKLLRETLGSGKLVSDEIVNEIVENKLKTINQPFILDGYPRTIPQANFLETLTEIDLVIFLNVSEDVIIKRILERGKTSNRPDDLSEEIIRIRLKQYNDETLPLRLYYANQKKLFPIFGELSKEMVFKEFENIIKLIQPKNHLEKLKAFYDDRSIPYHEIRNNNGYTYIQKFGPFDKKGKLYVAGYGLVEIKSEGQLINSFEFGPNNQLASSPKHEDELVKFITSI